MKNDLVKKLGKAFQFWKVDIDSYPTINYGEVVRVIQEPDLSNLEKVDVLTLMLSRPCDRFLRQFIRFNTRKTQHDHHFHIVFVVTQSPNATCNKNIEE